MSRTIIVVPCYNEAERLAPNAFETFLGRVTDVSFLFVDDGSTDQTGEVLEALSRSSRGRCRTLALPENRGKAEAVRAGVLRAFEQAPEYVGFWDADLATPLDAIPDFCRVLDGDPALELVMGARVQLLGRRIDRSSLRHYVGRTFATVVSLMLGLPVYDTQCGAKLFRVTELTKGLFLEPFTSRWVFDVEILARMIRAHRRKEGPDPKDVVYELPLTRWRDVEGSKLRLTDFVRALPELYRIYRTVLRPGAARQPSGGATVGPAAAKKRAVPADAAPRPSETMRS